MPTSYPLSSEMSEFVAKTLSFSSASEDINEQRRAYSRMSEAFTPTRPAHLDVGDFSLGGVAVRSYRPQRLSFEHPAPCVMYIHGGGWVVGDLDSHDFLTAALAADLNAVVVAVDYRLAPEHPFPAGFGDCLAVWHALQIQAQRLDIDPRRIAIAGDSAGGNLAAAVCLALRDSGEPQPVGQALIYPELGGANDLPSRRECADAPLLSTDELAYYRQLTWRRTNNRLMPGHSRPEVSMIWRLRSSPSRSSTPCVMTALPTSARCVKQACAPSSMPGSGCFTVVSGPKARCRKWMRFISD